MQQGRMDAERWNSRQGECTSSMVHAAAHVKVVNLAVACAICCDPLAVDPGDHRFPYFGFADVVGPFVDTRLPVEWINELALGESRSRSDRHQRVRATFLSDLCDRTVPDN